MSSFPCRNRVGHKMHRGDGKTADNSAKSAFAGQIGEVSETEMLYIVICVFIQTYIIVY